MFARKFKYIICLFCILFSMQCVFIHKAMAASPSKQVLILYDASGAYGWIGYMHSQMLANLMGHFNMNYQIQPVEQYHSGDINQYRALFYIGSVYNNPLPAAFIQDVMSSTTIPIAWFRYNLWQIAWTNAQFSTQFGFQFNSLDQTGYPTICYQGSSNSVQGFDKNQADKELGNVTITNDAIAKVIATATTNTGVTACSDATGASIPYIVKGNNLWYIADSPLSYISMNDRYLIFTDVLYDILQMPAVTPKRRAIVRLEDVDPTYDVRTLRRTADYLYRQGVPFAVSVIPRYVDPTGLYNNGVPLDISIKKNTAFVNTLNYMVARGGTIIIHGYTHQYNAVPNAFTAVSGDDYEFFRVTVDATNVHITMFQPVAEDSLAWITGRVNSAKNLITQAGLTSTIWESPHYGASETASRFFAQSFLATIGHILYFDGTGDPSHNGGQFYPYVINKDVYGQKVIPENLGSIEPISWYGYPTRLPADILLTAEKNTVGRDAWASFYYHPFLGLSYLRQCITGIKALGYTFVSPSDTLQ